MKFEGDAKAISSAFVKARGEMSSLIAKDARGNYGKYVTLAAIIEATTDALAKHGLVMVQEASVDAEGVCVESFLLHESGATMQFSPLTMPLTDRKPQAVGSAVTYARRYALGAICGLAPDDDDGQAAQDATRPLNARKDTQPPPPSTNGHRNAPQHATTPAESDAGGNGDVLFDKDADGTPPHQRLFGVGLSVFGPAAWNNGGRKWLLRKWSGKVTPERVRDSLSDFADDEKDALADYMEQHRSDLQRIWREYEASKQTA